MVRVLAGQGVLAEWFLEINDCATIDVISGFGDMPLLLSAETSLFDVHYPGRFLFGANKVSHNLIELLLSNDAEGIRLVHPNNNIYGFLHAKIYRARYDQGREDEVTLWAIGSANLTGSSLNRSIKGSNFSTIAQDWSLLDNRLVRNTQQIRHSYHSLQLLVALAFEPRRGLISECH